jgi:TorA maturation chaperone TorD
MRTGQRPAQNTRRRARRSTGPIRPAPRPLLALARLRQGTYRLLGSLLLDPADAVNDAPVAARYLRSTGAWPSAFAFYDDWERFLRRVAALSPHTMPAVRASYAALFGTRSTLEPVPLYESAFLDQAAIQAGWVVGAVERAYAAAGLRPALHGEPPDHVAVELEFISFLCGREAEALAAVDAVGARAAADQQLRFLEEHLCQWIPSLSDAVTARDELGFFTVVAQAAHAMVSHDVDLLGALLSRPLVDTEAAPEGCRAT